jgi:lysophospholipase L1-like esterase
MHTYALAQPRNAPVRHYSHGPWLFPACVWLGIHPSLWLDLSRLLLEELAACLKSIDLPNFHVVDTFTLTTTLIPADQTAEGDSHDWENEIHPNRRGYKKLADTWAVELARLLPR